ncbi:RnfH family protein [Moraxella haemolytica]|uniref:RnfH family protein n=1 Tax=Moraxella haemolytica TaxID=2904119 RepID=UPI0025431B4B|nr:RnfH family protein [Moraxella sp. ZY171148]WII95747.1 RnfH family protein [Moraxella sp. ZY171148]
MADVMVRVALAYVAKQGEQLYTEMDVPDGTTVWQVLQMSGWLDMLILSEFASWCADNQHASPNHKAWYVGIYGQKKRLDTPLHDGDRVEIYRALSYDPMTRRKQKSKKQVRNKSLNP